MSAGCGLWKPGAVYFKVDFGSRVYPRVAPAWFVTWMCGLYVVVRDGRNHNSPIHPMTHLLPPGQGAEEVQVEVQAKKRDEIQAKVRIEFRAGLRAELLSELVAELRAERREELVAVKRRELRFELRSEPPSELLIELPNEVPDELREELPEEP
jgi:hypothetical protein